MSKAVSNVPLSKDALLKSYRKRLRDDIGSMTANFMEIIKLCKTEDETQVARATQSEEDAFEMQVRASNMASIQFYFFCFHSTYLQLFRDDLNRFAQENP